MFGFDEDELARLSLQKAEDKIRENLYEKLVNAQKQATSQKELIHSTLADKLNQVIEGVGFGIQAPRIQNIHELI